MVHETTERDPERIYLEPWPYSPEGESERATGVEYIRADLHDAEIARLTREMEAAQRQRDAANRRHEDMCREVRSLTAYLFDRNKATRELDAARAENRRLREALERVVDGGCERFAGTDCWQMGMDPNAKDYADRVCDPCFARRALAAARRGEGGE